MVNIFVKYSRLTFLPGLHYYKNTASKTFTDFFVVEFEREILVDQVLNTATHSLEEEGASSQPIPVYSPFLWLSSGSRDFAEGPLEHCSSSTVSTPVPVYNDASAQSIQYSSISDQMIRLCQADEISDTNHR